MRSIDRLSYRVLRNRLGKRKAVLDLIDRNRAEAGDPNKASLIEKRLLDEELAAIERATREEDSLALHRMAMAVNWKPEMKR